MFSLILLNGGIGARVNADRPKQLIRVGGIPILIYTLVAVENISAINELIINYPQGYKEQIKKLISSYGINKKIKYIPAGKTRQESVYLMLEAVTNKDVLIHEAARPHVTEKDFLSLINDSRENITLGLSIPFTVAPIDTDKKSVNGVIERDSIINVQLPQKFKYDNLKEAHLIAKENGKFYTEDATLVYDAGFPVHYLSGNENNIKVTSKLDIVISEFLLSGKVHE